MWSVASPLPQQEPNQSRGLEGSYFEKLFEFVGWGGVKKKDIVSWDPVGGRKAGLGETGVMVTWMGELSWPRRLRKGRNSQGTRLRTNMPTGWHRIHISAELRNMVSVGN